MQRHFPETYKTIEQEILELEDDNEITLAELKDLREEFKDKLFRMNLRKNDWANWPLDEKLLQNRYCNMLSMLESKIFEKERDENNEYPFLYCVRKIW